VPLKLAAGFEDVRTSLERLAMRPLQIESASVLTCTGVG
jgi:hypothetical protein